MNSATLAAKNNSDEIQFKGTKVFRKLPIVYFLVIIATLIQSPNSSADRFRNSYISFELPPNWVCKSENTEFVCTSRFSKKSKEAIIILTAKEVGPTDTFATYLAYLKTPRTILGKDGKPVASKVMHIRERNISNHKWIDGMHMGSEVTSYYTRYLATIKERIAILVAFSAHKPHYTKYSKDFIKAVDSLLVVANKDLLKSRPAMNVRGSNEVIGDPIGQILHHNTMDELPEENPQGIFSRYGTIFGILLILIAIGVYVYLKMDTPPTRKTKRKK